MKNKVIVITGSSGGLGREMALALEKRGANVVISSRDESLIKKALEDHNFTATVCDVTKKEDVSKLMEQTLSKFGKIDVWINNAGIWLDKSPVELVDTDRAHKVFEVNFFGTLYGTMCALSQMKKQGLGMIVNIVSTSALNPRPLSAIYSASKTAVKSLTDSVREELKDTEIKVVGVYPGGIKTELFGSDMPVDFDTYLDPSETAEKIVQNIEKSEPELDQVLRREGQK